jgi:molybdopterin-guanine dinucleotide biosynthesis protein MobB
VAARIVSIIGRKNAGKTTLTVALVGELLRRRLRVMTIKHGHHAGQPDTPGSDSWRHFQEAGAERTLLAGPEGRVLFERAPDLYDPVALARRYLADADIIVAEGYKRAPIPKIEVHRLAAAPRPLYDPAAPNADEWIAIVTDDPRLEAPCRVLRFNDTMWLQALAGLALERGLPLDA